MRLNGKTPRALFALPIIALIFSGCSLFKSDVKSKDQSLRNWSANLTGKYFPEQDKIVVTWAAPKRDPKDKSKVTYHIFGGDLQSADQVWENQLAEDVATKFELESPTQGKIYYFNVSALVKTEEYKNTEETIAVPVDDGKDNSPPLGFNPSPEVSAARHDALTVRFNGCPQEACIYFGFLIKDLPQDLKKIKLDQTNGLFRTSTTQALVTGLSPAETYDLVIVAVDGSGNVAVPRVKKDDSSKFITEEDYRQLPKKERETYIAQSASNRTLTNARPTFSARVVTESPSGVPSISKVNLSWLAGEPLNGVAITGYTVYVSEERALGKLGSSLTRFSDYFKQKACEGASSDATMGSYVTGTTCTVPGLESGKTYYFVVRAYVKSGSNYYLDTNVMTYRHKTKEEKPVKSYAGVRSAIAEDGIAGLNAIKVTYNLYDPDAEGNDGIANEYRIYFQQSASCPMKNLTATQLADAVNAGSVEYRTPPTDTQTEYSISGLSANKTYCFMVRARYSGGGFEDSNANTVTAETVPPDPEFSGLETLELAADEQGFNSFISTWTKSKKSWTKYVVSISTSRSFPGGSTTTVNITNQDTLSYTALTLTANTRYYAKVEAVFEHVPSGIYKAVGGAKVLDIVTTPLRPLGEKVTSILAAPTQETVAWQAPTNSGAVYNKFFIWKATGTSEAIALDSLNTKMASDADGDYQFDKTKLQETFTGLTTYNYYCFNVRAAYVDGSGNTLLTSASTSAAVCKKAELEAPPCGNMNITATVPSDALGFEKVTLTWPALSTTYQELFSYYEASVSTDVNTPNWDSSTRVYTINDGGTPPGANLSTTIGSLTANTTYYFRIRCVNANGSPNATTQSVQKSAKTTPIAPSGDSATMQSAGATKALIKYKAPTAGISAYDVYIFVQEGDGAAANTFKESYKGNFGTPSVSTYNVLDSDIQVTTSSSLIATITSFPAIVKVPKEYLNTTAGVENNIELRGFTPNNPNSYSAIIGAMYRVDGVPYKTLDTTSPTNKSFTPTAGPPIFSDTSVLVKQTKDLGTEAAQGYKDFTNVRISWTAPSGDCTEMQVSVVLTTGSHSNSTFQANLASCIATYKDIGALTPHKSYKVQVRALNKVDIGGGNFDYYYSTITTERTFATKPTTASGDKVNTGLVYNDVAKNYDTIDGSITEATAGYFNKSYVWVGSGTSFTDACQNADTASTTKSDNTGPNSAPFATITKGGPYTFTYPYAIAGAVTCFVARSVYDDGTYYLASANSVREATNSSSFSDPTFTGLDDACTVGNSNCTRIIGTWSDGGAKIEFRFGSIPTGNIEEYKVYYHPVDTPNTSGTPWMTFDLGDATYDANSADLVALGGGLSNVFSGSGNYIFRASHIHSNFNDTNTKMVTVTIPSSQSNYVKMLGSVFGLGYDIWVGRWEAGFRSGTSLGGTDTANLTTLNSKKCNKGIYVDGSAPLSVSDCYTSKDSSGTAAVAISASNATPVSSLTWDQALFSCYRGSVAGQYVMRLLTDKEWELMAQYPSDLYSDRSDLYKKTGAHSTDGCNTSSGSKLAGSSTGSACSSALGIRNVAGNVREYVLESMQKHDLTLGSEQRFGIGPGVGETLFEGLQNITRRYNLFNPGSNTYHPVMGSDYQTTGAYEKQYSPMTKLWVKSSLTDAAWGFRCGVVFLSTLGGTNQMVKLAQPSEPVYTTSDYSGAASTWTIPENLYAGDARRETLTITVNGNTTDSVAEGEVTLTWKPWTKISCQNPTSCTTYSDLNFTYYGYRFEKPDRFDESDTELFAIANGPYASASGGGLSLNPLALDQNLSAVHSTSASANVPNKRIFTISGASCNSSTPAGCTFTDSTSAGTTFNPDKPYLYIIIVKDAEGNYSAPMVQRMWTPFIADETVKDGVADILPKWRLERRYRLAWVRLVDEYAQSLSDRQVMSFVPMDLSGHDYDFYIYKYEATLASGSASSNTAADEPRGHYKDLVTDYSTEVWSRRIGYCVDNIKRTGSYILAECGDADGDGTPETAPTAKVTSWYTDGTSNSGSPYVNTANQGEAWRVCRNTFAYAGNGSGTRYYSSLTTQQEFHKAAQTGDQDFDQTADVGPIAGLNVNDVEEGTVAGSVTAPCITNGSISSYRSGENSQCRSRYGVYDFSGLSLEYVSGQYVRLSTSPNQVWGSDDGETGYLTKIPLVKDHISAQTDINLWFGITLDSSFSYPSPNFGITMHDPYYPPEPTNPYLMNDRASGVFVGGGMGFGNTLGRFAVISSYSTFVAPHSAPTSHYWNSTAPVGFRCVFK